MDNTVINLEKMDSSAAWDSGKGFCSEAPCGAAEQNPVEQRTGGTLLIGEEHLSKGCQTLENVKGLTEKVGTLGLQIIKKNCCGAAKKRARKDRLAEAPTGDSSGDQPQSVLADQPHTQQKPRTSGAPQRKGSAPTKRTPPESGGQLPGPSKRQWSAGGTPEDGCAKRPKQTGQPSYARASREGHRVAVMCEDYPKSQVYREHFVDIQQAIGQLVDELPEEGFTPRLADSYCSKGAAIMVCQDEMTKDWLAAKVPTLVAWEGSRLKVVDLDALPPFKRVDARFLGSTEDTERCSSRFHRLNRGLDTGQWRIYGVRLVLSIDTASATVLEGLCWRTFSSVGQAIFSLLGA